MYFLRWMFSRFMFAFLIVLYFHYNIKGAGNVLMVYPYIYIVLFLILLQSEAVEKMAKTRNQYTDKTGYISFIGVTFAILMVWYGWFFTAFAIVVEALLTSILWNSIEKKQKELLDEQKREGTERDAVCSGEGNQEKAENE